MTNAHETPIAETLTPESFLEQFQNSGECFLVTGGVIGGAGETESVTVSGYHAPIGDLVDPTKLRDHGIAGFDASGLDLALEITPRFRYGFDAGDTWFRVGRRGSAFLHVADQRVPARLVTVDYSDEFVLHWLYREESEAYFGSGA